MNYLAILKKAEQKKQKLNQAQMVITRKSACPVR